jgi:hypothetical protein
VTPRAHAFTRGRRRGLAALFALSCVAGAAHAGGGDGESPAGPRLSVEPPAFDFGRTQQQRVLSKQFRLRNFGDRALVIGEIQTDCGCTAALLETPHRTLAPGAATTLDVRFETRDAVGSVRRHVLIRSNDPVRKVLELKLEADVQPEKKKRSR